MPVHLTDKFVAAARARKRANIADEVVPGLRLRISPSGIKAWSVYYRVRGSQDERLYTLGQYPDLSRSSSGESMALPRLTTSCEICTQPGHMGKPNKASAAVKKAAGITDRGLLHRFRDTLKTRLSEHGVDGRVSEHILGHAVPGIAGIYDHAELRPRRTSSSTQGSAPVVGRRVGPHPQTQGRCIWANRWSDKHGHVAPLTVAEARIPKPVPTLIRQRVMGSRAYNLETTSCAIPGPSSRALRGGKSGRLRWAP